MDRTRPAPAFTGPQPALSRHRLANGGEVAARGAAVTIGNFDGVHRGHRALVARALEVGERRGLRSVALTFDRHPATVVRPGHVPRLLTGLEQKVALLLSAGVDEVAVLRFDAERAGEEAEDFVRTVLVGELGARAVVVGASFRFGHRQHGDVALLEAMGGELGFEVEEVELLTDELDGRPVVVSSTVIRSLVSGGRLEEAARLLGRPHEVPGVLLGPPFPGVSWCLSVEVRPELLLPPPGRYAGDVAPVGADERDPEKERDLAIVTVPDEPPAAGGILVELSARDSLASAPRTAGLAVNDQVAVRFAGRAPQPAR